MKKCRFFTDTCYRFLFARAPKNRPPVFLTPRYRVTSARSNHVARHLLTTIRQLWCYWTLSGGLRTLSAPLHPHCQESLKTHASTDCKSHDFRTGRHPMLPGGLQGVSCSDWPQNPHCARGRLANWRICAGGVDHGRIGRYRGTRWSGFVRIRSVGGDCSKLTIWTTTAHHTAWHTSQPRRSSRSGWRLLACWECRFDWPQGR